MKFFKVIICFFAISYSSTFSAEHFDSRIGIFRENKTFEEENPDVIFAGAPGLTYRCYIDSQLDFSMYEPQSPFQWMLDLKYDLEIAENQCNWSAKEKISKEILETIGGKYGLSELDSRDSVEDIDAVIDFMNMAALHASMAMEQVAVQRKTTELCKKHLGIEQEELQRVYAKDVIEQKADLNLDKYLEEYLEKVDITSDELKIDEQKIEHTENNIEDIRDLARVLSNPDHSTEIYLRANDVLKKIYKGEKNKVKVAFIESVNCYIAETFDLGSKPFLLQIAKNYFMKLYDKSELLLRYKEDQINLKLRDCGWIDVYGNTLVCSYNSLLEIIRQEKGNEPFINFSREQLNAEHEQIYFNHMKETFLKLSPLYQDLEITFQEKELIPSNDLSSKSRSWLAADIFFANKFFQQNQNKLLKVRKLYLENKIKYFDVIGPSFSLLYLSDSYNNESTYLDIFTRYLDLKDLPEEELAVDRLQSYIGASFGINSAFFCNECDYITLLEELMEGKMEKAVGNQKLRNQWPEKSMASDRTIIKERNTDSIKFQLQVACITSPFSAIVGQAGFNQHARTVFHK